MSVRHLKQMQKATGGKFRLPVSAVLALSDNLNLCDDQSRACDFSSAPRFLGPDNPIVVDGTYTYVYAHGDDVRAFFKLQ